MRAIRLIAVFILGPGAVVSAWCNGTTTACVQDAPGAQSVAKTAASTALCSTLQTSKKFGCRITNGSGSCTAVDSKGQPLFTATSAKRASGAVDWQITDYKTKVDAVLVNQIAPTASTACSYTYTTEAVAGDGLGQKKSDGTFVNPNYLEFCSDGQSQTVDLPPCPTDVQNALNDGSIPGEYAIVGQISDANTATLCVKENAGISVQECINLEGATSSAAANGLPLCSDGPDTDGDGHPDGSLPFKRNITFIQQKVGDSSCTYTCVPPPMTIGGRSQCGYICKK